MNMTVTDWALVIGLNGFALVMALGARKYTRTVADFLSANRCAGRYLLGVAAGEASLGAISIVTLFEIYMKAGFTREFWYQAIFPIAIITQMMGFVIYRYRA